MKSLKIKFEHCYGIKKLEKEFDFSEQRIYLVYAPNGTMKTSLAKTFIDIQRNKSSGDEIFPTDETVREAFTEDGTDLCLDEVFVVEPYNADFNFGNESKLLVNKELKNDYDMIHKNIDEAKHNLIQELRTFSGLRDSTEVEREISYAFRSNYDSILSALESVSGWALDKTELLYADILYTEIFNEKVLDFLETEDFKIKIASYIKTYDELIGESKYFKKGVFNHNNAAAIAKNLAENGFFEADHSVSLNSPEGESIIAEKKEELEKVITKEKDAILNDSSLAVVFNGIDKALNKNKELRRFRDYLNENEKIIIELGNLGSFRQKLWVSYLKECKILYEKFIKEYQSGKEKLDEIIEKAKLEETAWKGVIDIFNKRFSVPFKLAVENQEDVILKSAVPIIALRYKDNNREATVDKSTLMKVLSRGESRAMYLLNTIFEVETRKKERQTTLFIVDDIADSFDYKNKYAIVEYLREISEQPYFRQIILTHNFDFFRTIQSRLAIPRREYCLMVEKSETEIKLIEANYLNPFEHWMNNLHEEKKLIVAVPFFRNIAENTMGKDSEVYLKLTSILHMKADSFEIRKKDIEEIHNKLFPNLKPLSLVDGEEDIVLERIFVLAEECLNAPEGINLENKILLAIAIRLKAEKYMLSKLTDKGESSSNQTRDFFDRFKHEFGLKLQDEIGILEQVNLMTPENIHLNSFMYEPILDMGDGELRQLYKTVTEKL